jgi:hypothetical protein
MGDCSFGGIVVRMRCRSSNWPASSQDCIRHYQPELILVLGLELELDAEPELQHSERCSCRTIRTASSTGRSHRLHYRETHCRKCLQSALGLGRDVVHFRHSERCSCHTIRTGSSTGRWHRHHCRGSHCRRFLHFHYRCNERCSFRTIRTSR